MVKSFAFLVVTAEAATCTGTKDLVVSEPQCYHGGAKVQMWHQGREISITEDVYMKIADFGANGAGHLDMEVHQGREISITEDVDMKIADFGANGAGHMDMEVWGDRVGDVSCSNKVFTKSGLKITTDLSDCLNWITFREIDFCSDQDAVEVTVNTSEFSMKITLSRVACSGRAQHGLALSQVLTSKPLKQYMEEPVQQHAAMQSYCGSAQSEDECNMQPCQCCRWLDLPSGARLCGLAEQELGLALSQVLTSKSLKQYAALGNSFTADDSISGVVEEEPDMALV